MKEVTPKPGGTTEVVPVQIWTHDCFKATQVGEKEASADKKKSQADAVRRAAGLRRLGKDDREKPETVPIAPVLKDGDAPAVPLPAGSRALRPGAGPLAPLEPKAPAADAAPRDDAPVTADVPAPPAP